MEDWSGLYLLAEVCDYEQWVSSAPLIPLDFPKKKRSLRLRTTKPPLTVKISQTVLGKRCHFKVDDDDDDDDFDRKGKKKMKMKTKMKTKQSSVGSDVASTSYGAVDHRGKDKEETSGSLHQTQTVAHLNLEMGLGVPNGPNPNPNPNPTSPPRRFMDRIQELGGSEVKLVIEKTLTASDLKKNQNRITMPCKQLQSEFLTAEEKEGLRRMEEDGKHHQGMQVIVIEPNLEQSALSLKKWDYNCSSSYVFIKNWFNLALNNRLQPGMVVQIWSFRVNDVLCFAIVNLSQE